MSYKTTSTRRSVYMVKVKNKGVGTGTDKKAKSSRERNPPAAKTTDPFKRPGGMDDDFDMSPPRRTSAPAAKIFWDAWKTVPLITVIAAATAYGFHASITMNEWAPEYGPSNKTGEPAAFREINIRPMGLSQQSRGRRSAMATGGSGGEARASRVSHLDESDPRLTDGSHVVTLPADASGNCEIGARGLQDFGACLARNGARASKRDPAT